MGAVLDRRGRMWQGIRPKNAYRLYSLILSGSIAICNVCTGRWLKADCINADLIWKQKNPRSNLLLRRGLERRGYWMPIELFLHGECTVFLSISKWHGHLGRVSSRAGSPCHQLTQKFLQAPYRVGFGRFSYRRMNRFLSGNDLYVSDEQT